jgi:hypothetical protein
MSLSAELNLNLGVSYAMSLQYHYIRLRAEVERYITTLTMVNFFPPFVDDTNFFIGKISRYYLVMNRGKR